MTVQELKGQCLNGWKYKTPIIINNIGNDDSLFNYQIRLSINTQALIAAGKMKPDGADIRFTSRNCCEFYPFWFDYREIDQINTEIWVNIPVIPAHDTVSFLFSYGNHFSFAAKDSFTTFDFYDGFDLPPDQFNNACGTPTTSLANGQIRLAWSSLGMMKADSVFSMDQPFTAEMKVDSVAGVFPSIGWRGVSSDHGYSMLVNYPVAGRVNIVKTLPGGSFGACNPVDSVAQSLPYSSGDGVWSLTWRSRGAIIGNFPTVGDIFSLDTTFDRTENQHLVIGGIFNGNGSLTLDWVRVRKYTFPLPSTMIMPEGSHSSFTIPLGQDTSICANEHLLLDAFGPYQSYSWSVGDSTASILAAPPGTFSVTAENTNGCPGTGSITLTSLAVPEPELGPDQEQCEGAVTAISPGGGFINYIWSTGSTQPSIVPPATGSYSVQVSNNSNCLASDTIQITIHPRPIAGFGYNISGATAFFFSTSTGASVYDWYFGDGNSSTQTNPTYTYSFPGNYEVRLIASSQFSCKDTVQDSVELFPVGIAGEMDEAGAFVAWYTIDDQNLNIRFLSPRSGPVHFKVYSLYGQILFAKHVRTSRKSNFSFSNVSISPGQYYVMVESPKGLAVTSFFVL